ncbi:hypothetical protein Tco_1451368, partial [Tanacetum coccineum]
TDTPYLLDGYGVLVFRIVIFKISSFKLHNARLLLSFTNYSIITAILKYKRLIEEFDLMAVAGDLDEIKEVNANCILMANLQQASTSGTQTDNAPVYDSDGSANVHNYDNCYNNDIFNMFTQEEQYAELLEPILEPHQVQQNDSNVNSAVSSVEQEGEEGNNSYNC